MGRILLLGMILALASCKSVDYYRDAAVEKAREYALAELRDLTELQRDYIRYNTPVIMENQLYARAVSDDKSPGKDDYCHTSIVWSEVPGLDYSIIVFGMGERRMNDWTPYRLIRKEYIPRNLSKDAAIAKALMYTAEHMPYLTAAEYNKVRFSPPLILGTNFQIGHKGSPSKGQTQKSMVWDSGKPDHKIVISGYSYANLDGWMPLTGLLRPDAEVKSCTIRESENVDLRSSLSIPANLDKGDEDEAMRPGEGTAAPAAAPGLRKIRGKYER